MSWMVRLLVALLALLLVLAVLAVLGAWAAPALLKPRLEAQAARALGRPVTIASLRLTLAWPPTVVAEQVGVPGLGTLRRATATLDPGALGAGAARVALLDLQGPDLVLTIGPDGRLELPAPPPPTAPRSAAPARSPSAGVPRGRAAPGVARVQVEDGRLTVRDTAAGRVVQARFSARYQAAPLSAGLRMDLPAQDGAPAATLDMDLPAGQPAHAVLASAVEGQPLRVALTGGPLDALAGRAPGRLSVIADLAGAQLSAAGTLAGGRYDLDLSLRAGGESELGALFGWQLPGQGPIAVDAQASGDVTQAVLRALHMHTPQGDLAGDLTLTFGARPRLSGSLAAQRLDVDALLAALPRRRQPAAAAPGRASAPAARPAATLIPDRPLPFGALLALDADLSLRTATLHLGGADYHDLAGHLALADGRLALDPIAVELPGGAHLAGTARVDAAAAPPVVSLRLHAPSVGLAPLLAALHLPPAATGDAAIAADLRAAGASPHALAATLDGSASVRMAQGTIEAGLLEALAGGGRLPIAAGGGHVGLRCLALSGAARQGVVEVSPLLVDSGRVLVQGEGSVDLGQETLDLHLRPLLRGGIGLIVPVRVAGSWRAPRVRPDSGAALGGPEGDACQAAGIAVPPGAPAIPTKLPKPADLLRQLFR